MPDLHVSSTPLPADVSPTLLDALRVVAHQTAGDYTLLRAGPATGVVATNPLCRLLIDAQGHPRLDAAPDILKSLPALPSQQPLFALQTLIESLRFPQPHPMVGWLGFLSYDLARFLESITPHASPTRDDLQWPTLCFTLFQHYLVFDPNDESPRACTLSGEHAPANFDWAELLRHPPSAHRSDHPAPALLERQSPAEYAAKIQRVKDYIAAGDIYQANLAQRWTARTPEPPHEIFAKLCELSPAPFAACLRFSDGTTLRHVVSASPELFLSIHPDAAGNRTAITRPIKGTRPRDLADTARDESLREELLNSTKDHAELTMIVDLLRNDLGRVADFGSVQVVEPREIEQHPTVWHTVATITAHIRRDARLAEILAALCPGGSITGAPKIRAMQIIEELEGFRRALYCGNIGVIGDGGNALALNIAIRTILFQGTADDSRAYVYAGGGIVADSAPTHEFEETLHKAAALFRALGIKLPDTAPHGQ